ncbi:MAG: hypothetical protein LW724_11730, partial [Planctomycetaceae bacterium]|nr:hypothetical protein [Planctomycetaceae bacterium]
QSPCPKRIVAWISSYDMLCGNNGALEPFTQNLGTCKPIGQKTAGTLRVQQPVLVGFHSRSQSACIR